MIFKEHIQNSLAEKRKVPILAVGSANKNMTMSLTTDQGHLDFLELLIKYANELFRERKNS